MPVRIEVEIDAGRFGVGPTGNGCRNAPGVDLAKIDAGHVELLVISDAHSRIVGWSQASSSNARATDRYGHLIPRLADTGDLRFDKNGRVALRRMDNVGIVVESLDAAIAFFAELGLELEGRSMIEGDWSGRVTGLRDQRVEIAMMRMPDGHGRIELSRFLAPPVIADHRDAPVNALGYLRVMFAVDDLDDTLVRLRSHGAQVVDEVVQYEDVYRLCYVRGPEGILIGLAEQIG